MERRADKVRLGGAAGAHGRGLGRLPEERMLRRIGLTLPAALLLAFASLPGRPAAAQPTAIGDAIVGVWTLVSVVSQREDGSRGEPFGPNPKGLMMFSRDGH